MSENWGWVEFRSETDWSVLFDLRVKVSQSLATIFLKVRLYITPRFLINRTGMRRLREAFGLKNPTWL